MTDEQMQTWHRIQQQHDSQSLGDDGRIDATNSRVK
jgi:hypothetical protein